MGSSFRSVLVVTLLRTVDRRVARKIEHLDQVEAIQLPPHDERRRDGRYQEHFHGKDVRRPLHDEREAIELGIESPGNRDP